MWHIAFLTLALLTSTSGAAPEYRAMGPDIFDPKLPGAPLVAQAVTQAQRENKRIVLLFGANWCPWCRRLHAALTQDAAIRSRLKEKFVLVLIDANTRNDPHRNAALLHRYGDPVAEFGLPVFVVLDRDGKQLTTQETETFSAGTDTEVAPRVLAFLDDWAK